MKGWNDYECDHSRAYIFFAESIVNNRFRASKCEGFLINCTGENSFMGGEPGHVNKRAEGIYYLKTNAKSPFGQD